MRLLHMHTSFREDFINQRKLKKLSLAIIIDAVGFYLGKDEFEDKLVIEYNNWLNMIGSKKRLDSRLNTLRKTCDEASDVLKNSNTWLDILELPVNFVDKLGKDNFTKYKIELSPLKDIDRLIRPYHGVLDRVDEIQFV